MDVLYTVRPGDDNEELRYSLRSLKNLPHDKVFIVGYKPYWVKNVTYIPNERAETKYKTTTNNILKACQDKRLSDDFIIMNDDFYIMHEIRELKPYHRGNIYDVMDYYERRGGAYYAKGIQDTIDLMKKMGIEDLVSYELHVPMIYNKQKFIEMIALQRMLAPEIEVVHKRTLYGNMYDMGGEEITDVKLLRPSEYRIPDRPFLSSNDDPIKNSPLAKLLKQKFPDKSLYEK